MLIENTTIYNEETIEEVSKVVSKKYKSIVGGSVILLIAMAVISSLLQRRVDVVILAIYVIGIILLIAIGVIRVIKYKKNIIQRIKVINHKENVECKYTFDDKKTVISVENRSNTLYHSDIKKVICTANHYIVIYQGEIFAVISKNGFDESKHQAFCELFKPYIG